MNQARKQITIRLQQQFSWLGLAALLLVGAMVAGSAYGRGVWLFAAVSLVIIIGFARDALIFDGQRLKRRGPGALLGALALGRRRELAVDEIESISGSIAGARQGDSPLCYRLVILGSGCQWVINSRRSDNRVFIKSLLSAVSPHKLDPCASELLAYGQDREQLRVWNSAKHSPASMTPPRLWRSLANSFALQGELAVAARYFHLAYRQGPRNAHLLYEMGRFLRLRATLEGAAAGDARRKAQGARRKGKIHSLTTSCSRRAEACLRLAGRLGHTDAALLERIGETFFEFHHHRLAQRYFERALQASPNRVRANIGLAEVALRSGQAARVVHFYRTAARAAEDEGEMSLAGLAAQKADYYARLLNDEGFLNSEVSRLDLLDQLKWARRGAMFTFLIAWLVHLTCYQFAPAVQAFSREISATSAIIWVSTVTASYFFSQRRN